MSAPDRLRVCHVIAGDQWAGAEAQVTHLLGGLARYDDLELSAVLFAEGRAADEIRRRGLTVAVVDERLVGRTGLIPGVAGRLEERRPHILHTHRYKENIVGALAGRWAGIRRFVRTEHGLREPWRGLDRVKMGAYGWLDRLAARFATDRVIAVSADLHRYLTPRLPVERVVLVRNGIDPAAIVPRLPADAVRRTLGLPPDAPVFVAAGRLMPVKGIEYLVAAAREVRASLPGAVFVLVGDGPIRPDLESLARRLGVGEDVIFSGFREDVVDVVNAADVFVMPSLHEGLPMALLEAMALGKPVVASAVGGIPEIVRDIYGWLVPPRDVGALAAACVTAMDAARRHPEPAIIQKRVEAIAEMAATMCEQTRAIYRTLAAATTER